MELIGDILENLEGFLKDSKGYESDGYERSAISERTNYRSIKTWQKNSLRGILINSLGGGFLNNHEGPTLQAYFLTVSSPGRWLVLVSTVKLVWAVQLSGTSQVAVGDILGKGSPYKKKNSLTLDFC